MTRTHTKQKVFIDTEFMEQPSTIELLSIGLVADDGREFYAVNSEADLSFANPWVESNVLPYLLNSEFGSSSVMSRSEIKEGILEFTGDFVPEFWGYYADYDWVVFCWLFGPMIGKPEKFPMYCKDIKQWCDDLGNPQLPKQTSTEHNALEDARWNKVAWHFLNELPRAGT